MLRNLTMVTFPACLLYSVSAIVRMGPQAWSSLCESSSHILWDFPSLISSLSFIHRTDWSWGMDGWMIRVLAHEYGSLLQGSWLGMGQACVGVLEDPLGRLLTGCAPHLRPGPLPHPHKHTPDFAQTQLRFYLC